MTPDKARQLLIQAKCDGCTDRDYLDSLHALSGLRCEYRVIHPIPGTMVPKQPMRSEAEAEKVIESARHFLGYTFADQLIIQRRLTGEWENLS